MRTGLKVVSCGRIYQVFRAGNETQIHGRLDHDEHFVLVVEGHGAVHSGHQLVADGPVFALVGPRDVLLKPQLEGENVLACRQRCARVS